MSVSPDRVERIRQQLAAEEALGQETFEAACEAMLSVLPERLRKEALEALVLAWRQGWAMGGDAVLRVVEAPETRMS